MKKETEVRERKKGDRAQFQCCNHIAGQGKKKERGGNGQEIYDAMQTDWPSRKCRGFPSGTSRSRADGAVFDRGQ